MRKRMQRKQEEIKEAKEVDQGVKKYKLSKTEIT
jgi:hypothetical protein